MSFLLLIIPLLLLFFFMFRDTAKQEQNYESITSEHGFNKSEIIHSITGIFTLGFDYERERVMFLLTSPYSSTQNKYIINFSDIVKIDVVINDNTIYSKTTESSKANCLSERDRFLKELSKIGSDQVNNFYVKIFYGSIPYTELAINFLNTSFGQFKNGKEDAEILIKRISGIIDNRNSKVSSPDRERTFISVAAEIERFYSLKTAGVITEEEFQKQKSELLNHAR